MRWLEVGLIASGLVAVPLALPSGASAAAIGRPWLLVTGRLAALGRSE